MARYNFHEDEFIEQNTIFVNKNTLKNYVKK